MKEETDNLYFQNFEDIKSLMEDCFTLGYYNIPLNLENILSKLFEKYGTNKELQSSEVDEDGFKIWSVEDLKKLPPETTIMHKTLGLGVVNLVNDSQKAVFFLENSAYPSVFGVDGKPPWNEPVKILYIKKKPKNENT